MSVSVQVWIPGLEPVTTMNIYINIFQQNRDMFKLSKCFCASALVSFKNKNHLDGFKKTCFGSEYLVPSPGTQLENVLKSH